MRSKTILYLMGFVILLIVAGLALLVIDNVGSNSAEIGPNLAAANSTPVPTVNATATAFARRNPATYPEIFTSSRTPSPWVGIPAIQPHLKAVNPATPTFTEQDVKDYIKAHPDGPNRKSETIPTVDKIEFITYREFKVRQNGAAVYGQGLSDDHLLCYVELSGTFVTYGPPTGGNEHKMTYNKALVVFDAQTGNILTG